MHTNLIVDVQNLGWIVRFSEKLDSNVREKFAPQLILQRIILDTLFFYGKYQADGILMAYDSTKSSWRKDIYPKYKVKVNQEADLYKDDVFWAIDKSKELLEQCSSIKTCRITKAEADDVIAVACQNKSDDIKNIVISTDKDFIQLTKANHVEIVSPVRGQNREAADPDYSLFEKCIRGDTNDNIPSSYPRVRKTKLEAAWNDPTEMLNLMETVRKDGGKVEEDYQFNKKLIDLSLQPEGIRRNIYAELMTPVTTQYSQAKFMRWVKECELKVLESDALSGKFSKMFRSQFRMT